MLTLSLCAAENFEEVMEFYMPMVYRIAFARLADRSDAEDVTQDVFLRYFRIRIRGTPEGMAYPVRRELRQERRRLRVEPPQKPRRTDREP